MIKTEQFIKLLGGIFDKDFAFDSSKPDFADYQKSVTGELIKRLYELSTNEQREGLLNYTFNGFLGDGKDYVFSQISQIEKGQISKQGFTKKEYTFLLNCLHVLNGVILDVSETCLTYDINFARVIDNALRSLDVPKGLFAYYMKKAMGYKPPVSILMPIKTSTTIQNPTIRAFCRLVSDSGIMPIGGKKINQHCKDVCAKYNLTYNVKVSQDYNKVITPQLKQKVQTFILSSLSDTDRQKIEQQINNDKNTYG